jgi:hypothetical protein
MKVFPYFATPNTDLQAVAQSVTVAAAPDEVWSVIGDFGGDWHPLTARIGVTAPGIGQLRTIETLDGREIIERLEANDNGRRCLRYTCIAGMPVSHYTGALEVKPSGKGAMVEWRVQFLANRATDRAVKVLVSTLLTTGLESLKPRFGAVP